MPFRIWVCRVLHEHPSFVHQSFWKLTEIFAISSFSSSLAVPISQKLVMSFQRFDISPNPARESKRPHLSVFRFASFQSSRRPSQAPPAYSPDDVLATQKQLHVKVLHWLRIAIASITFLVSIVIIACSATALRTYTNTRYNVEWILPLWPSTVDLRPTHALLACGVIVAVASIFYIVVAVAPTVSRTAPFNVSVKRTDRSSTAPALESSSQPNIHHTRFPLAIHDHLHHRLRQHHRFAPLR